MGIWYWNYLQVLVRSTRILYALYHPDSTQYRYQAQEADPLHIRYISDMPPCKYGISAGVLLPACTVCCSVSSHPTSTLTERAGIIRWALCEMRGAPRKCTTETVCRSRCLWESLQTIKGLRATKETMPSFRSNDLGLGPIIASDASGAWCLGSHTGRVGSGHVSGGKTQRAATRARASRAYPHRRLWKRSRDTSTVKAVWLEGNIRSMRRRDIAKKVDGARLRLHVVISCSRAGETSFARCHKGRGHRVI